MTEMMEKGLLTAEPRAGSATAVDDPTRLRPVDWFTMAYLGITLIPILFFLGADPEMPLLLAGHVLGIGAILAARRFGLGRTRIGEFILTLYPVPLFAFLYIEVGTFCRVFHDGALHDDVIQRVEVALFGGHPSQDLYLRLGSKWLGEYLHLGYIAYYVLSPLLVITLWFRRSQLAVEQALACTALSFYISFLIFMSWPVAGPYQTMTPPEVSGLGFVLPKLARSIIDSGSSIGAAFPSSHVAVAVTIWIMAMRFHKGLAIVYALLVPALSIGAIYGGFHYATDVVAGAILGVLVGTLGFKLTTAVSSRGQAT
jgi:membrane-associated phospholipid phosphatase